LEQASAFGALSVVVLAILGGVMIPRFVMPAALKTFSALSPLYWGLESYQDILVRKMNLVSVLDHVLPLVGFAVLFLIVSRLKFRWSEVY
jgi:ABC-2 type transport system permease protein